MNFFQSILEKEIKKGTNFVFVSPHLDDAIFSAGGLISYLISKSARVLVINVFSNAGAPPYSLSAKRHLQLCGYEDANELYKKRVKEDSKIFKSLGVSPINLGFVEALYRRKNKQPRWGKILPEYLLVYPTYRWHIVRGKISEKDAKNVLEIKRKVKEIIAKRENCIIFCPIANAAHVDHVIVRNVCSELCNEVVYWDDYPYNLSKRELKNKFVENDNYKINAFDKFQNKRLHLIKSYKSQIKVASIKKNIKLIPEKYYFKYK